MFCWLIVCIVRWLVVVLIDCSLQSKMVGGCFWLIVVCKVRWLVVVFWLIVVCIVRWLVVVYWLIVVCIVRWLVVVLLVDCLHSKMVGGGL